MVAANDSMDSLTEALSTCQEQLRLAEQGDHKQVALIVSPTLKPQKLHSDDTFVATLMLVLITWTKYLIGSYRGNLFVTRALC